jgi:hypothetical protein
MEQNPFQEADSRQLIKKRFSSYETWIFITMFTRMRRGT